MLIVKQDKNRKPEEGQIFVELTSNRGLDIVNCDRLGYWCDKAHLSHFIMECATYFTQEELRNVLKMNGNNLYIEKRNLLDAYKNGNADNKEMLEHLFGKELFHPKNIMDRVKTFEDALRELDGDGEDHPLVTEFENLQGYFCENDAISKDVVAYLKLRIITAALNEGWTPQFTKNEYRYFPWFWFYTNEEIDKMSKEECRKVVLFGGGANDGEAAGCAYAHSDGSPASSAADIGSHLCFKSSELAKYAGAQFAQIYFDFMRK